MDVNTLRVAHERELQLKRVLVEGPSQGHKLQQSRDYFTRWIIVLLLEILLSSLDKSDVGIRACTPRHMQTSDILQVAISPTAPVSFAVPAVSGNAAAAPVINQTYGSSFSRLCETMPIAMSVYNTQHMNQAFLSIGVRVTAPT